jgi:hypothetical protein
MKHHAICTPNSENAVLLRKPRNKVLLIASGWPDLHYLYDILLVKNLLQALLVPSAIWKKKVRNPSVATAPLW